MSINNKTHPHNAVFCRMLQSVIDGAPKTVQYRALEEDEWIDIYPGVSGVTQANWDECVFYRIKPSEPVKVARTVTPMAAVGELEQCVLSGQVSAAQLESHYVAGELNAKQYALSAPKNRVVNLLTDATPSRYSLKDQIMQTEFADSQGWAEREVEDAEGGL